MTLYELSRAWQDFCDQLEDLPEDVIADTLEAIEGEFDLKVDSIACIIKQEKADIKAIGEEIDSLTERKKAKGAKIDRLQDYLMAQMIATGKRKVETARSVVTVAKTPPKVVFDYDFINWAEQYAEDLLTYKQPEPNKTAIKKAIQNGEVVEHAHLEEGQSLRVK